jgi:haloalkane dehalogenase
MSPSMPSRHFSVDAADYSFREHWLAYRDGYLHYLDEGNGVPIVLLHGNPTWSYLYRQVIRELASECRLLAPDYPGFGFSKAPSGYGYTPAEHAEAVAALIGHLALEDFVLVVQDWGGPIGMSYAVDHPGSIRGVVIMNSWAWEASVPQRLFSLVMGGRPLGLWLQTRRNFFARRMVPRGVWHKEKLTPALLEAYTKPFPTPSSRYPTWVFPRHIRKSRDWLRKIEEHLPRLSGVPAQILWGRRDEPGFRPVEMHRWQQHFPLHETEALDDAAHFVQEDRPDRLISAIRRILARTSHGGGVHPSA